MGEGDSGRMSFPARCLLAIVLIAAAFCVILWFDSPASVAPPGNEAVRSPGSAASDPGEMMIGAGGGSRPEYLLAGDSRESFEEYMRAVTSGDQRGVSAMIAGGRVFPVKPGTKVMIIDRTLTMRGVRISDGKRAGQVAWFPAEFVVPAR